MYVCSFSSIYFACVLNCSLKHFFFFNHGCNTHLCWIILIILVLTSIMFFWEFFISSIFTSLQHRPYICIVFKDYSDIFFFIPDIGLNLFILYLSFPFPSLPFPSPLPLSLPLLSPCSILPRVINFIRYFFPPEKQCLVFGSSYFLSSIFFGFSLLFFL